MEPWAITLFVTTFVTVIVTIVNVFGVLMIKRFLQSQDKQDERIEALQTQQQQMALEMANNYAKNRATDDRFDKVETLISESSFHVQRQINQIFGVLNTHRDKDHPIVQAQSEST